MKLRILSIIHKPPSWIQAGYQEYAKRLPALEWVQLSAEKRLAHSDIKKILQKESEKLLSAVKPGNRIIALDVKGQMWSTEMLAKHLAEWQQQGTSVDFLIGGADGLGQECLAKAEVRWSLSPLIFPHILVPVIIAEQLYRAQTILQNHPYHRG